MLEKTEIVETLKRARMREIIGEMRSHERQAILGQLLILLSRLDIIRSQVFVWHKFSYISRIHYVDRLKKDE